MTSTMAEQAVSTSSKWRSYPAYRDCEATFLASVPDHWLCKPLKQLVKSPVERGAGQELPFVALEHIVGGAGTTVPGFEWENVCADDCAVFKAGDVLYGKLRPYLRKYLHVDRDGCCPTELLVLRPSEAGYTDRFLFYVVQSQPFVALTGATSYGVKMPRTAWEDLGCNWFWLPTASEQHAIVALLDRETAKIDALVSAKERQTDILREKRTAVIAQAVIHGLDTDVALRDSGSKWLGMVPSHWDIRRNKTIFVEVDERSTTDSEELLTVSHITGVTPRAEKRGVNMFLAETTEGYKTCQVDDLVINTMWAWMGALGFTTYAGVVSPSYHVYRLRSKDLLMPEYLDLLYRTSAHLCEIMRYSRGIWTSRLRLYPEEFLGMRTPVPPVGEQQRICEYIEAETGLIDGVIDANIRHIELLRERRTALISAAVTGQVDVREEM